MRGVLTGLAMRRLAEVVQTRLAEEPVLVLNGPRTVGKSTLLGQLAGNLGRAVIDCDDLATRTAVREDPARFVESDQLVLIDEYQHVPELLDAIKAQLNQDLRPGRYVLAGSTRYATLPEAAQALTGRVDIIPVLPLSQGGLTAPTSRWPRRRLARPVTSMPNGQPRAACRWPFAARPAGRVPAGSLIMSIWSSTRTSWTSPEYGSARCCPGCWGSSRRDPARS